MSNFFIYIKISIFGFEENKERFLYGNHKKYLLSFMLFFFNFFFQ